MLSTKRRRKIVGIGLIVVGILFLLVANRVLLGWENVWPLFSVIAGVLILRAYASRKSPEMLFGGITAFFLGVLLFFFSIGLLPWSEMSSLWPAIPLIAGVALLVVAVTQRQGPGSLVAGIGLLLFAVLGFLHNTGFIDERVVSPFLRFWPLVLIVAGIVLIKARHNEEGKEEDPDMKAVREAMGEQTESDGSTPSPVTVEPPEKYPAE
jgi:hypothetical protein